MKKGYLNMAHTLRYSAITKSKVYASELEAGQATISAQRLDLADIWPTA